MARLQFALAIATLAAIAATGALWQSAHGGPELPPVDAPDALPREPGGAAPAQGRTEAMRPADAHDREEAGAAIQLRGRLAAGAGATGLELRWDDAAVPVAADGAFALGATPGRAHRLAGSWQDAAGVHVVLREVDVSTAPLDLGDLAPAAGPPAELRVVPSVVGTADAATAAAVTAVARLRQQARVATAAGTFTLPLGGAVRVFGVPDAGLAVDTVVGPATLRLGPQRVRLHGSTRGVLQPGRELELALPYVGNRTVRLQARWTDPAATRLAARWLDPGNGRVATSWQPATRDVGGMVAAAALQLPTDDCALALFAEDDRAVRHAFALLTVAPDRDAAAPVAIELVPVLPARGTAPGAAAVTLRLAALPDLPLWSATPAPDGSFAMDGVPPDVDLLLVRGTAAPQRVRGVADGPVLRLESRP